MILMVYLQSPTAALDFYNAKGQWLPTWTNGDGDDIKDTAALKIDSVKVWAFPGII